MSHILSYTRLRTAYQPLPQRGGAGSTSDRDKMQGFNLYALVKVVNTLQLHARHFIHEVTSSPVAVAV